MIDHASRVARVVEKLSQARRRALACFGSESHRFELTARRSEADLRAFEQQRGVELPEAYRAFLLYGGGGGAGPYYGLYPLEAWDDVAACFVEHPPADLLQRPSPLRVGSNDVDLGEDDEKSVPEAFQGAMTIGTQGCQYFNLLIVSGECRGRVAYVDTDGGPVYVSREPDFLAWYERWLDELLGGFELSWYGYGPGGGEEELLAIIAADESDDELKGEAARNLCRLPRLSPAGAAGVQALLSYRLAAVRAAACSAVARHKLMNAPMSDLLHDTDAGVRRHAVSAVMEMSPSRWANAVSEVLRADSDDDVVRAAFWALDRAHKLRQADILDVLMNGPKSVRPYAVEKLDRSDATRKVLIEYLADENEDVRLFAALNLRGYRQPPVDLLIARLDAETNATTIDHLLTLLTGRPEQRTSDTLLRFLDGSDAFQRIAALKGLVALADLRALPSAERMLKDNSVPERRSASGVWMSHSVSIAEQARAILRDAKHRAFRDLARRQ